MGQIVIVAEPIQTQVSLEATKEAQREMSSRPSELATLVRPVAE